MRLSKLTIENFRGIKYAEIELDREITVLIGENNTGKTSVLDALRLCLDTVRSTKTCNFGEYDFYRDKDRKDLSSSEAISITVEFLESSNHLWQDHIAQTLDEVVVGSDYSAIRFRVTAQYDSDAREPVQSLAFLDDDGNELVVADAMVKTLRQLRPFFFQTALRAAKDNFHGQSTYWASFLRNQDIDDATRRALEEELFQVNQKIVNAHASFNDVTEEVEHISELVAVGKTNPVTVDPAPPDIYKALRYDTEVNLRTTTDAKIPIRSHGEGTQSLAVLLLFRAYLETRLKDEFDKNAEPIIAVEEPEAHLHPSSVRSVWRLLCNLPGQKIVATHSGDIISEVPATKLRRMSRTAKATECKAIPDNLLTVDEQRKFNHHVRRSRGELLFARSWLLVEGETEVAVFTECADLLGMNLHNTGVRIVEYRQSGQDTFIKVADALDIGWVLLADGDKEGARHAKSAEKHLNGRQKADHIISLSEKNMEVLLCVSGFSKPYADRISKQRNKQIETENTDSLYWERVIRDGKIKSKPAAAFEALFLMRERHAREEAEVPDEITKILTIVSEGNT